MKNNNKSEAAFKQPVIIYQSTDYDDTQDVQDYLSAIAESDVTISKTRNGDLVQVAVEGDDEAVTAFIDAYREGFDGIIKGAGKDGWVKPEDVMWYPKAEACKGEGCDKPEGCDKGEGCDKPAEEKLCKAFEVLTKSVLTCCDNLAKDQSLAGEFDDEVIYAEDAVKNAVESFKQMGEAVKVLKKALESHKNEDNMEVIGILSDAISKIVADDVAGDVDAEEEGGESVIDQVEREYGNEPEGGEEPEGEEEPTEF